MITVQSFFSHSSEKKFLKLIRGISTSFDEALLLALIPMFDPLSVPVTDEETLLSRLNHMIEDSYALLDGFAPQTMTRPIDRNCYTSATHCIIFAILTYKLSSCSGLLTTHIQEEYEGSLRMMRDFSKGLLILCELGTTENPQAPFCYESGQRELCKYSLGCDPCDTGLPYDVTRLTKKTKDCCPEPEVPEPEVPDPEVPDTIQTYPAGEAILAFKPVSLVNGQLFHTTAANFDDFIGVSQASGAARSLIPVI